MRDEVHSRYYCPKCNMVAETNRTRGSREFAMEVLGTSYFLCGKCRLIFISKQLVRQEVASWWRRNNLQRVAPLKYFYDEAIQFLYGDNLGYFQKIGYKLTRFKKQPV